MAPLQGGIGPNGEDTTMNEKKNIGIIIFLFSNFWDKKIGENCHRNDSWGSKEK